MESFWGVSEWLSCDWRSRVQQSRTNCLRGRRSVYYDANSTAGFLPWSLVRYVSGKRLKLSQICDSLLFSPIQTFIQFNLSFSFDFFATMPRDLLYPSPEEEARIHKLKRLVQSPNSFFMDIKCPGCFQITTVFSHAQTVVMCGNCNIHLCEPTGGKARLTEGCSYRKKVD